MRQTQPCQFSACSVRSCSHVRLQCAGSHKGAATLKEIGPSLVIVLLSLVALAAGLHGFDVNVNAPKAIALCWVLYNLVPHALLLIYAAFGAGRALARACTIFCAAQALLSALALTLLWLLYPREADYEQAASLSLNFLFAEWSGPIFPHFPVLWRGASGEGMQLAINMTMLPPPVLPGVQLLLSTDLVSYAQIDSL